MIPRYSMPKMTENWDAKTIFKIWFEIEAHACDALAKLGVIPEESAKNIWEKGLQNIEHVTNAQKIKAIEDITKHDVIAFLTNLAEVIGEDSRFVHQGMTSSDVLDSTLSIQLTRATDILIDDMKRLLSALQKRANETKYMVAMGRSHGIHAEPVTMGLKFARFYAEMERNLKRLEHARAEIAVCAISGAVGTFANIDPFVQDYVAEKMGVLSETISTQVIPRDRHAMYFSILAVIAGSIENIAVEVRHLQRTEVLEAEEYFSKGQKGSSAMPHKRNPVLSENITGLARLIRGYAIPALENVALWHERDISHSSVERVIAPDATIALDFALNRLINIVENLIVYPENMEKNLNQLNGLIFSQRILLALTQAGVSREDAYKLVQRNAMKVWKEGHDFLDLLQDDAEVIAKISKSELEELFNIEYHTKNIDKIFASVFDGDK